MTLRALVVGLGSIGQRHARNLRTILGDELVLSALRSRRSSPVVSDQLSSIAGNPESDCDGGVFVELAAALAARPDVVIVSNPTSLHLEVASAAVLAGAAVFVEKPIAADLRGIDDLGRLVAERDAVLAVGCQLRFHPALLRLRELLGTGVLGPLVAVHAEQAEYLPSFHPYEDYRLSYAARRELGGGVVLTQIHEIDYLTWIFGIPSSVYAVGGHLSSLEIDVEDVASALFAHDFGGRPLPVHLHLDYLQRPSRRTCRVTGEAGTIDVDLRSPSLRWTDADGETVVLDAYPEFARADMFLAEMRHFLAAVRGEHPVAVDLADGVAALRVAIAVRDSIRSGAPQPLR